MHRHHVVVRLAVLLVALVGAERRRDASGLAVGAPGHERRDRRGGAAAGVGVIGHAVAHQVGAEVRVAEAELAEGARVDADLLGRVAGGADDDLLGQQHDVDGVLEGLDVERAVGAAELHQVQRGEVAGRVVDVHVLAARVRGVDAPAVRAGVPAVDRRVVLHARVRAAPGRLGDLAHQLARATARVGSPVAAGDQLPLAVLLDGAHEFVGHAHRVVGVLVLDRLEALAVDRHVKARVAQRRGLVLLLAPCTR